MYNTIVLILLCAWFTQKLVTLIAHCPYCVPSCAYMHLGRNTVDCTIGRAVLLSFSGYKEKPLTCNLSVFLFC